jgi:hypothetical protein
MKVYKVISINLVAMMLAAVASSAFAADKASGTVVDKIDPASADIKYGYLLRGPDVYFDTGANGDLYDPKNPTMLRIILSSTDIGAQIRECVNLSCATEVLKDGVYFDYANGKGAPHDLPCEIRFSAGDDHKWNNVEKLGALTLSSNKPDHLAGKLHIDFGGYHEADVDFDLTLFKTFKTQYQLSN